MMRANEKAKVIKMVVNNLNVAMEEMSREIRVGYHYNREANSNDGQKDGETPEFLFLTKDGCRAGYKLDDGVIKRMKNILDSNGDCTTNADWLAITGEDIEIKNLKFAITGIGTDDNLQPRVMILLEGEAGRAMLKKPEVFNLQTTISQRKIEN